MSAGHWRDDTIARDEDGTPIFAGLGLTGSSDTEADTLIGGAGADVLMLGGGDIASGGGGGDEFILGDWIAAGAPATITDFQGSSDIVVVALADDNADANVEIAEDGPATRHILIDGTRVASVSGSFDQFDGFAADLFTTTYTPL